jgi:hypothetical protein
MYKVFYVEDALGVRVAICRKPQSNNVHFWLRGVSLAATQAKASNRQVTIMLATGLIKCQDGHPTMKYLTHSANRERVSRICLLTRVFYTPLLVRARLARYCVIHEQFQCYIFQVPARSHNTKEPTSEVSALQLTTALLAMVNHIYDNISDLE